MKKTDSFADKVKRFGSEEERMAVEIELISRPERAAIYDYLRPLNEDILKKFGVFNDPNVADLMEKLEREIDRAVDLFIENNKHKSREYPFSVYYTWFAKTMLENNLGAH